MRRTLPTLFAAAALLLSSLSFAEGAGFGTYSEGYRMGQLSKFSVKGMMFKSGEGQLLMGREGTPYVITSSNGDGGSKQKVINPWYFSADPTMVDEINNYAGKYVYIEYKQAQIKSPKYDTDYMVTDIKPVTRKDLSRTCVDDSASGKKSEGFRIGRIVKVSKKGHLAKTYEVMIQVGNAGNQFKAMSISSDEMYRCALEALQGGRKVKVNYIQSFLRNPLAQDTSYNIHSIEPLEDI